MIPTKIHTAQIHIAQIHRAIRKLTFEMTLRSQPWR